MRGARLIGVVSAVSVLLVAVPTPVMAAPPEVGASEPAAESAPPTANEEAEGPAAPEDGGDAVARGDLQTALDEARDARKANPTVERWAREGEVLELMGDHAGALVAYRDGLAAARADESADPALVADIEARIEAIEERSRGTVPDEPESTHRDDLDAARAARIEAARPKPPPPVVEPPPPRDDRVVNKWYFWVTLGTILATAGVITGIAVKSSLDEQKDALDRRGRLPPAGGGGAGGLRGPAVLRF